MAFLFRNIIGAKFRLRHGSFLITTCASLFLCGLANAQIVGSEIFSGGTPLADPRPSNSDYSTSDATAVVLTPISISAVNGQLSFGTIVPTDVAGTVQINPDGPVRTPTNVSVVGNSFEAAVFEITGEAGADFNITLPDNLTIFSGGNSMPTDLFASFTTPSGTTSITPSLIGGLVTVSVGATLHVAANQPSGSYTNSFDVTVSYQ